MPFTDSTAGDKKRYRMDPTPCGEGGYAEVFRAEDKATGEWVALKRLKSLASPDAPDRMRREIRVQRKLVDHPNVMPVRDADPHARWYVMPFAEGTLKDLRSKLMSDAEIADAAKQAAKGLAAAHDLGYVHRDVTPSNILALDEGGRRTWVVSDFGMVRNPKGMTTAHWTRTGQQFGTEGFVAPEVRADAHRAAKPVADIYSLGRVVRWAVTGEWPDAGDMPHPPGPFRQLIKESTRRDPARRIPTVETFLDALDSITYQRQMTPVEEAEELSARARHDVAASERLLDLAHEHRDLPELFFDHLPAISREAIDQLVTTEPLLAAELVEQLRDHFLEDEWGRRDFNRMNKPLRFIHEVARAAEAHGDAGLLEDSAEALFEADYYCSRYDQRRSTRDWLASLKGSEAEAVGRALKRVPQAAAWYTDEGWSPPGRMHGAILDSLHHRV